MRTSRVAALALLFACAPPPPGDPGHPRPHGLVWVDAAGAVAGYGAELAYVDPDGLVWSVDPETGQPSTSRHAEVAAVRYWSEPGCAGAVLISVAEPPLPRVPFRLPWSPSLWVRDDAARAERLTARSTVSYGGCVDAVVTGPFIPGAAFAEVAGPPHLPFTGPLHIELVAGP